MSFKLLLLHTSVKKAVEEKVVDVPIVPLPRDDFGFCGKVFN